MASEAIRDLAAAIVADLRATPRGMTMRELTAGPGPEQGSGPSIKSVRRAIEHCREHGVLIEFDRHEERWRITSERDHLPAAALSREDLIDQLRYALGEGDPLEMIDNLKAAACDGWHTFEQVPLAMSRHAHGLNWRCRFHHHQLTLSANRTDDPGSWMRVVSIDLDASTAEAKLFADYLIERNREKAEAMFAEYGKAAASW